MRIVKYWHSLFEPLLKFSFRLIQLVWIRNFRVKVDHLLNTQSIITLLTHLVFKAEVFAIVFFADLFRTEATGLFVGIEIRNRMCFYAVLFNYKITGLMERVLSSQMTRPIVLSHNRVANRTPNIFVVVHYF